MFTDLYNLLTGLNSSNLKTKKTAKIPVVKPTSLPSLWLVIIAQYIINVKKKIRRPRGGFSPVKTLPGVSSGGFPGGIAYMKFCNPKYS